MTEKMGPADLPRAGPAAEARPARRYDWLHVDVQLDLFFVRKFY